MFSLSVDCTINDESRKIVDAIFMSVKTISNATFVHALFQNAMEEMDSFCGFLLV